MSTGIKVLLGVGTILVLIVGLLASSYIGAFNSGNRQEQNIDAAVGAAQVTLSTMTQTVMESAQVPAMARDDLTEVIRVALEGRYGEGGSGAFLQAMTEAYPGTLDMALYTRIQDQIESGRRNYADSQVAVIDRVRAYKTDLGSFWTGTWMRIAGYPKINLAEAKYNPIINAQTGEAYRTGVDTGIQLPGRAAAPAPAPTGSF